LAIRQAVASKANITYKILYNHAVAMTGGQDPDAEISVANICQMLKAEGVGQIIILSDDHERYKNKMSSLPKGTLVWDREKLDEAQRLLREEKGVTALIYDQGCAANLRRLRKRGLAPEPDMRVMINERVCEGCGDCGDKSNCLSVLPIDTDFGRKTQIHQSSCNKDYSCLEGDCPAFVTVIPDVESLKDKALRKRESFKITEDLTEPRYVVPEEANLYLVGIGGTGVVTVNQILSTAAALEGKRALCLDQTGLSQKGGPVSSHIKLRFWDEAKPESNKIAQGQADSLIIFDLLSAGQDKHLSHASPAKSHVVANSSKIATGSMVKNPQVFHPEVEWLKDRFRAVTASNYFLNAIEISEQTFGSHMPANLIVVGAAYQQGLIPISAKAIERAMELNGVSIESNKQAFRLGRKIVLEGDWQAERLENSQDLPIPEAFKERLNAIKSDELLRLLKLYLPELSLYQNQNYAKRYLDLVEKAYQKEQQLKLGSKFSEAVASYLFKLMAYKDEYEVARLYLREDFEATLKEQFGEAASFHYQLHPPILKKLGLKKKIGLGTWFKPIFKGLYALKFLRGTPLDIFGYDALRREERTLIKEYRQLIEELLAELQPATYENAVQLASLPDMVRGYEALKLKNIAAYRQKLAELRAKAKLSQAA
ncbi:MAG: DUF6537 domain-containing protein, partial [Deinococcales bacterium]